jgi:hypothetical protein
MYELSDLLLYNLTHCIVQPSLGFPRRCHGRIDRDVMSAKSRADALEILEGVTENSPTLF